MIKHFKIWTIFVVICVAGVTGYYLDAHHFILDNDFTYLSFVNMAILVLFTLCCLYHSFMGNFKTTEFQWYTAEAVLSLGMVGTLAGFLAVLYSTFQGLDVGDTESMKQAIETLATGMGTALLTSLVGLVSSIIMKLELVILEGKVHG